jgi:uncharacterized protein (TIGR00645 family)
MVVTLVMLLVKVAQELVHYVVGALTATEADIIVGALSLVDLTLTASLIVIVIFSGYENFVSRMTPPSIRTGPNGWARSTSRA